MFLERIRVFGLESWGLIHFSLTAISRLVDLEATVLSNTYVHVHPLAVP